MLMPSIFGENLFDDWMDFSFPSFDRDFYGNSSRSVMKTDVKETDKGYELDIELPGYQKEDVKAQLKDGYLTVQAVKNVNNDTKNEEGAYIRRERYAGTMSRSFYVGDRCDRGRYSGEVRERCPEAGSSEEGGQEGRRE